MHYHDSDDLKRLGEFKQLAPMEFSAGRIGRASALMNSSSHFALEI